MMCINQSQSVLSNVAAKLKNYQGKQITIVKFSEFGFPVTIQCTLGSATVNPYAEGKETLQLNYKPRLSMNGISSNVYSDSDLIIFKGWVRTIDNSAQVNPENSMTVSMSDYQPFDRRYLKEILWTVNAEIIVQMIAGELYNY